MGGVIRGAGKQSIGALCNIVGYYLVGFPIGVSLMFAAGMGIVGKGGMNRSTPAAAIIPSVIQCNTTFSDVLVAVSSLSGLWTGLLFCVSIQAVFFLVFLSKLNWQKASHEVKLLVAIAPQQ